MPDADSENRCPKCHHSWVTHGSEPDTDGCWLIMSSMAERTAMAEEDRRLQRQGVPPEAAGPRAYRNLRHCGCLERPPPGSEWDKRLPTKRHASASSMAPDPDD
jgi:hypothetical protein